MRETCARVLAAALMTGAIAAVVAMSALFDTPQGGGGALTAPPSSLQRSVRVEVPPAPRHPPVAERLTSAQTRTSTPIRRVIVSAQVVRRTIVVGHRRPPRRQLAAVRPKPAAVMHPAPAPVPTPAPASAPAAATPPPASSDDHPSQGNGNGNGNGNGHAEEHGPDPGHGHGHGQNEHEN